MDSFITQLGVGGIFAIVVIREVFNFIKSRNNKDGKEEPQYNFGFVNRSEFEEHKKAVQYKDNCEQIVKRIDSSFNSQEKRFDAIDRQFGEVKLLIKNSGK